MKQIDSRGFGALPLVVSVPNRSRGKMKAVKSQQSTVNSQQPTVSSQRSTFNHQQLVRVAR
eukprot:1922588-Lingulodinium_polyedra.AAC.1